MYTKTNIAHAADGINQRGADQSRRASDRLFLYGRWLGACNQWLRLSCKQHPDNPGQRSLADARKRKGSKDLNAAWALARES